MKTATEGDTVSTLLAVVADLLRGDKHSRRTIAGSTGKSLPTADRWIEQIEATLPNTRRMREGKTTWLVYDGRRVPSRSAATGACVAASLASAFEGSAQERNLKDARDYILKERGEVFGDLERKFVLAPRGGEYALPEAGADLDEIVEALLQNARLRFEYRHNDGRTETLTIEVMEAMPMEPIDPGMGGEMGDGAGGEFPMDGGNAGGQESLLDKIWRFLRGLFGLGSEPSNGGQPVEEFVPMEPAIEAPTE